MQALPTGSERSEHKLLLLMGVFVIVGHNDGMNQLSPFEGLKYVFPYEGGEGQKGATGSLLVTEMSDPSSPRFHPPSVGELFRSGIMLGKSAKGAISEGTEQFIDGVSNTARDMKEGLKEANSFGELAFGRIFSPFSR
uniref:Uncharacterized protein n=1 Tax=Timema poppense TaxID=170557 RepID=A0A7R9CYY0_TIMPO|nr:unnamed protein product [Timema poppensis]